MHGLNSFVIQLDDLFWNRNDGVIRLVLVDVQDFMFGNLFEPQRLIVNIGFVYCGEELGGEIIVYRAGNVVLYLHGHPSLASDSRKKISMDRKQLRAIALDGMKGSMDLITGELDNVNNITTSNILGSLYAENIIRGGHGNRLLTSAIYRDMLMPDGKNAIDRFRGSLTIHDIMYPCTKLARKQWRSLGGPVMPADWWLVAETQKEALAKRHGALPFNRADAVTFFKAGIKSLEKKARVKALESLRQKDEAEFFEQYGMSREEANQKYPRQKTVKNPPRPLEVQAQREERDRKLLAQRWEKASREKQAEKLAKVKSALSEKEKRAKALEWQRRKEEAEFFESYGMSREDAACLSRQQWARIQREARDRKLQAQREERDRKLTEKKRSVDTTVSSSDVQASRPPKRQKKSSNKESLASASSPWNEMTVAELKTHLKDRNLPVSGLKAIFSLP